MTTSHKNITTTLVIMAVVIVVALSGFFYHIKHKNHSPEQIAMNINIDGTVLPSPRIIHPFNLTDNHDKPFNNTNLKGHWTLMFFGFTNCGYVCPTTLSALNTMYTNLKSQLPPDLLPQIVMVSVDPERDSTTRINDYVRSFNPTFIGARANLAETTALANQMSAVFSKVQMPNGDYTINHSAEIMLLDPNGNLRAFFSYPHKADQMLHDYVAIVHVYNNIN
jgi:protein SCO1/2